MKILCSVVKVGECYEKGIGVEQSHREAFRYYENAAESGSTLAWGYLADAYEKGIGVEKSDEHASYYRLQKFEYCKEEADHGNRVEQATVGKYYETGYGVVKSIDNAVKYYQLSADQNAYMGQYYLAECYAYGKGVLKSSEKAIYYYTLSANQGYVLAAAELGRYLIGENIDLEKGQLYLQQIADGLNECRKPLLASCQYYLAKCYESYTGIGRSEKRALDYYKKAAENGNSSAQVRMGDIYREGRLEVQKSPKIALYYYDLSAAQNDARGLEKLGDLYMEGIGVAKDPQKAFHYFKASAALDMTEAESSSLVKLAYCYEKGLGTEKSLDNAILYYKLAAENGFSQGYYQAGACYKSMGGPEDAQRAIACFKLGATEQELLSLLALTEAFQKGYGVEKSESKEDQYLQLSLEAVTDEIEFEFHKGFADQGDVESQFSTGIRYFLGIGVEKSLLKTTDYLTLAANQGHANAKSLLSVLSLEKDEKKVPQVLNRAMKYFILGTHQGEISALKLIATIFEANKILDKAADHYKKAADLSP